MTDNRIVGSLTCTTEKMEGLPCLVLEGDIDIANVRQFQSFVEETLGDNDRIVFDLRKVNYLDSLGIHTFVRLHTILSSRRARMALVPSPTLQRLLEIKGAGSVLRVFATVDDALSSMKGPNLHKQ